MSDNSAIHMDVLEVFQNYPAETCEKLLSLRQLILDVAAQTKGVGELEETLKWRQISYLPSATKSGTTIRIDSIGDDQQQIGMFVNCQTTLVETYRAMYSDILDFDGDRCVMFNIDDESAVEAVKHCVELALTYHQSKKG